MTDGAEMLVDDELQQRRGERVTAVVQLSEPTLTATTATDRVRELQANATRTQEVVTEFARENPSVRIRSNFWITNAVALEVDTARTPLEEIARLPEVERVHENFEVEMFEGDAPSAAADSDDGAVLSHGEHTYGLEQLGVPQVWEQFGVQGEGARVAVLDTGIDIDHPDLDLYTEDPDDPTYPGGWAQWDFDGNRVQATEPYDSDGHGTHVSGTVAGADESGEHIGVAPDVELMHGLVIPGGFGTYAGVIGGIQWAVDNGADVINMSLGFGYEPAFIDPLQNAEAAGTLTVSSSGNGYEGSSGSPGNVYGAGMAIGASAENEEITDFSSGEKITTAEVWGSDAPSEWPAEYIVPDVAAPGAEVTSSTPGDEYDQKSGTSMASPHVAGVAGLMVSASDGLALPEQIQRGLETTAWKPEEWDESQAQWSIDGKDSRYGEGIVDAVAAVGQVALDTGVTGVVESEGEGVEGVTVELDGIALTTDATGGFELLTEPGEYDLTVSSLGIEDTTVSVTVEEGDTLTDIGTISVDPTLDVELQSGQSAKLEGGESVEVLVDVYNVDTIQIGLSGTYSESDATLQVDGQSVAFDTPYDLGGGTGEVSVVVETALNTAGEIELQHTFTGLGDEQTVSTGPTTVYESVVDVGIVDAAETYGEPIAQALAERFADFYRLSQPSTADVADDPAAYDAVVVQNLNLDSVSEFVTATTSPDVGVVYLDQLDEASGIEQFASESGAVTDTDGNYDFEGSGGISYEATAKHPILDQLSAGDTTELYEVPNLEHTWFDLADNSGFEPLGEVILEDTSVGSGLAVDGEKKTVLASSLGRSESVEDEAFTAEANAILARAVEHVALDTGLTGVVESEGQAAENATVELDGIALTTDAAGDFDLLTEPGEYDLTVSGLGIEETTVSVTVEEGDTLTDLGTISVDPALGVAVLEGPDTKIEGGESVEVLLDVYSLDTLQVALTGPYAESDVSLSINGLSSEFGTAYEFSEYSGDVSVTVETTPDTPGELGLEYVATGRGDQQTLSTGPTTVYESVADVGIIDADETYGEGITQMLAGQFPDTYRLSQTTTESVVQRPGVYDAIVVQKLDSVLTEEFVETTTAADIGVVYLDQRGEATGVSQFAAESSAVTGTDSDYFRGAEGVAYDVPATHPIFGRLPANSTQQLYAANSPPFSWFTLAEESGFERLGMVSLEGKTVGTGLAVDDQTRTVLASSLGRSGLAEEAEFTEVANAILTRAVGYVADVSQGTSVTATATYDAGQLQLSLDCQAVTTIRTDGVWADWSVDDVDRQTNFTPRIDALGQCRWDWNDTTDSVAPTLTLDVPTRTYVGGTFLLTVTAISPFDGDEATVTVDLG